MATRSYQDWSPSDTHPGYTFAQRVHEGGVIEVIGVKLPSDGHFTYASEQHRQDHVDAIMQNGRDVLESATHLTDLERQQLQQNIAQRAADRHARIGAFHPTLAQEHHDRVLAENVRKNVALALIHEHMPDDYRKPALDSDGDPVVRDGQAVAVVKDKHAPAFSHDVTSGQTTITVPGLSDEHFAALAQTVQAHVGGGVILQQG